MNAIAAIEELRKLAFASGEASNWWAELEGEVRQGRRDARYLEKTLQTHLEKTMTTGDYAEYRSQTRRRQQYFFSGGGNIDGRFRGIGVEEKCAVLNRDKLLDGVLCRGLVWTLGNPQNIEPDQLGAFGIFVKQGAGLLQPALAQAYFGALVLARKANVHRCSLMEIRASAGQGKSGKRLLCQTGWLRPSRFPWKPHQSIGPRLRCWSLLSSERSQRSGSLVRKRFFPRN